MELNPQDSPYSTCLPGVNSSSVKTSLFEREETVSKAVIIAAGNGSRLQGYQNNCPKPLLNVGGIPLIQRVIVAAKKKGVSEFVIILGYQAARIRKRINAKKLGVRITWVRNLEWRKPNGVSLLKAEKFLNGRFLLFMSDHVFDPKILEKLNGVNVSKDGGLLCVDYRLNRVANLDDATKVRTENNHLINLGKSLTDFNAIDIGIFILTPAIFDALRQSQLNGDYSLSGGVRVLAEEGKMQTFNIGESYWQDVDTVPEVHSADRMLFRQTRSATDGVVAKLLNRRISNRLTKWLIKTPITPNQISIFNLFFTIFISWFVSAGKPLNTIIGGFLFQLASILDGCDGEVAQIKLKDSKLGAYVDTITDHVSYFFFISGVTLGAYNASHDSSVFYVGGFSLLFLLVALKFGLQYIRKKGSGSLRDLDQDIAALKHVRNRPWYFRFLGEIHHLGRRDLFSFMAMVVMVWGNITVFYWGLMGAVIMMSAGITVSALLMLSKSRDLGMLDSLKRVAAAVTRKFRTSNVS
jgi:CDP-L-myo-inositol myo-inositolphosphotransferase